MDIYTQKYIVKGEDRMAKIPFIFRKTKTVRNLKSYMDTAFSEVLHTTLNPNGPGAIRIHLIPPKEEENAFNPSIAIINGTDILPVNFAWAVILAEMIRETNHYDGKEIGESEIQSILDRTTENVRKILPVFSRKRIQADMQTIYTTIRQIAYREQVTTDVHFMSIGDYAPLMQAPHRMDLMVSAMTDACGKWQCNQKCVFCYAAGQEMSKTKELTTQQWKKAIDRLDTAGVPMVTFTGGEPTQRADIAELVGYAKRMVTRLNTNGVNLTPELVRELKKAGLDSVQVTLYSHDADIHNALVGSVHHADTVQGIRNAVAAGLDISVNTPLCRKNADYEKTLAFIRSLGVRFVTVSGLICTGMAGINHAEYDLASEELFEIVKAAKAFCNAHEMEMDFTSPGLIPKEKLEELGMNVPMCGAALSNMAIAPDGSVVPCQSWLGGDAALGNILTDPFKKIWKHPRCKELRNMSEEQALVCPFRVRKGGDRA